MTESVELQNLHDAHYRELFNRCDRNGDGTINILELKHLIESREYSYDIPDHVIKAIFKKADSNRDGQLDYKEFMQMINNPKNEFVFSHLKARYVQYVKLLLPHHPHPPSTDVTAVDGAYEDEYSCWPPAVIMIIISLLEVVLYCVDFFMRPDKDLPYGDIAVGLMYNPTRRKECWRYLTYMFVHIGPFHLLVNVFVQIMLGTPLEMVHKGGRVSLIYLAGVVAGSLGTSISDPSVRLAGASGGVYSLITAHIATIIMNWSEMSYPLIQLLVFIILTGFDIGTAVYNRYWLKLDEQIGYAAHLCGAIAGLLVGITVLRNIEVRRAEKILRWAAFVVYILLMGAAIIWNIVYTDYFPMQVV